MDPSTISQYDAKGQLHPYFWGTGRGSRSTGEAPRPDRRYQGFEPVLLVADRSNNRLQTFSLDGRHISFGGGVNRPCHFAERNGILLIPDLAARVTLMDRQNRVIVASRRRHRPALGKSSANKAATGSSREIRLAARRLL